MCIRDSYLYHDSVTGPKLLAPTSAVNNVLCYFHDDTLAGHPGIVETVRAITKHYYWPTIRTDVTEHIKKCDLCQRHKAGATPLKADLHLRHPSIPFQILNVDLMGPYPRTRRGHTNLLTVEDAFTRWLEAYPRRQTTTRDVTKQLEEHFFPSYGYPQIMRSDNGPQFQKSWDRYCLRRGITPEKIAIYHARANPVERQNQNIKTGLRIHINHPQNHQTWDLRLQNILFTLYRRTNRAISNSPAEMVFGFQIRRPEEWNEAQPSNNSAQNHHGIREAAKRSQNTYIAQIKGAAATSKHAFIAGSQVLVKNHPLSQKINKKYAGFCEKWNGLYIVKEEISPDVYVLIDEKGTESTVHSDQLKDSKG